MTDLRDVFADGDYELVVEALYGLRERKQAALHEAGRHAATSMFTARDFGVPQIDGILKRLDAEPSADTKAAILQCEEPAAQKLIDAVRGWMWAQNSGASVELAERYVHAALAEAMPGLVQAPQASGYIGIRLEGGVIQTIFTDRPMDVTVIDYDTEDRDEEDRLFDMPQTHGGTSQCLIHEYPAAVMPDECRRIRDALAAGASSDAVQEPEGMSP